MEEIGRHPLWHSTRQSSLLTWTDQTDVIFRNKGNFNTEILDFKVVDWNSQYHAILGRPTFVQFMAIPHYAYLELKMSRPAGVITTHGCFVISDQCNCDFCQVSDTL